MVAKFMFAAAALAAAAFAPLANADDMTSVRVAHADLNLDSEAGASALLSRIDAAARRACDTVGGGRTDVRTRMLIRSCRAQAVRDAVVALDAPVVDRVFAAREGDAPARAVTLARR